MSQTSTSNRGDDETICNIFIDDRLGSYEKLLDHDWLKSISNEVYGTKIEPAFFGLVLIWKGVTNTFRLPYYAVLSAQGVFEGMIQPKSAPPIAFLQMLQAKITDGTSISERNSRVIRENIRKTADEWAKISVPQIAFDRDQYWSGLLQANVMRFGIWSSQQLCYSAVYFGYENFIREIIAIAKDQSDFRLPLDRNKKNKVIDETLGNGTAKDLFEHEEIEIAREIRNALAHAGGVASERLKNPKSGLRIADDGKFSIMPENILSLYQFLQDRVDQLIAKLLQDSRFLNLES